MARVRSTLLSGNDWRNTPHARQFALRLRESGSGHDLFDTIAKFIPHRDDAFACIVFTANVAPFRERDVCPCKVARARAQDGA